MRLTWPPPRMGVAAAIRNLDKYSNGCMRGPRFEYGRVASSPKDSIREDLGRKWCVVIVLVGLIIFVWDTLEDYAFERRWRVFMNSLCSDLQRIDKPFRELKDTICQMYACEKRITKLHTSQLVDAVYRLRPVNAQLDVLAVAADLAAHGMNIPWHHFTRSHRDQASLVDGTQDLNRTHDAADEQGLPTTDGPNTTDDESRRRRRPLRQARRDASPSQPNTEQPFQAVEAPGGETELYSVVPSAEDHPPWLEPIASPLSWTPSLTANVPTARLAPSLLLFARYLKSVLHFLV